MSKNRQTTGSRRSNGQFNKNHTGNPNGRPRNDSNQANKLYTSGEVAEVVKAAIHEVNLDGWQNMISALGTGKDKSEGSQICVEPVTPIEARNIYRADSFGARIAEARPREMFRTGWTLKISDADAAKKSAIESLKGAADVKPNAPGLEQSSLGVVPYVPENRSRGDARSRQDARQIKRRLDALASKTKDLSERVMNRARDLEVNAKMKQALTLANVDGGCAILLGVNDGSKDLRMPLNKDNVRRPEQLKWLTVIEERALQPYAWYNDPQAEKYGQVAIWRITPMVEGVAQGVDPKYVPKELFVHETRLMLFTGPKITVGMLPGVRPGMGDSVYTRLKGTLSRYSLGWNSAAILLNEFSLAVMKIKGLSEMVSQDAQKKLMTRMAAVQLGRSIARVTLLDKDEDLTRDTASVAGLADLLFALMQELAGQADVPVTILMGMSPAGMNATGESDIRGWYDRIKSEWNEKVDPAMRYLLGLILRSLNNGAEPEKWCVDLNPLWQESPKDKAETRKIHADTDQENIANGLYSAEEARRSRYGGDEYGEEIVIDNEADDVLESAAGYGGDPDMAAAQQMQKEGALDPNAVPNPGTGVPNPGMKPGAAVPGMPSATDAKPPDTSKLLEIVEAVTGKDIPRESGIAILKFAFKMTDEQAGAILGPENFEAPTPPPPAPFGAGKPPIPGEKPPAPLNPDQKPAVPPDDKAKK